MQSLSIWDVGKCPRADISGRLIFRHQKLSDYMYSTHFSQWSHDDSLLTLRHGSCLSSGASSSSDRSRTILSCINACVFYPSVSAGSPAAESVFTVFHLERMENDVNHKSFPNPFCWCFIYS